VTQENNTAHERAGNITQELKMCGWKIRQAWLESLTFAESVFPGCTTSCLHEMVRSWQGVQPADPLHQAVLLRTPRFWTLRHFETRILPWFWIRMNDDVIPSHWTESPQSPFSYNVPFLSTQSRHSPTHLNANTAFHALFFHVGLCLTRKATSESNKKTAKNSTNQG